MPDRIDQAVDRLRAGELVVIPTETVYGLAADASNPDAVAKIFALKGRPPSRPLIVHLGDATDLDAPASAPPDTGASDGRAWARDVPDEARALAARFWPGPLTLVLPRGDRVPDAVTGGLDTVGLRVPDQPLTLELLRRFGGGVAAPSANRYGRISPTTPEHVRAQFGARTPFLLDGGPCPVGIESTIVACLDGGLRVLRVGSIPLESISAVVGRPVPVEDRANDALRAPGQDETHYAPTTPTHLVPRSRLAAWRTAHPGRCGFLGFADPGFEVAAEERLPRDPEGAARRLYAALHLLDDAGVEVIVVEEPPDTPEWRAVRDRLRRAAGWRFD